MRSGLRKSSKVGCVALLFVLVGCQGTEDQEATQQLSSALVRGTGGAGGAGDSLDLLTTYTARCEAATGIHVPTFDCTKGVEVPQGTSFDELVDDNGEGIPAGIAGTRVTRPPVAVPPNPPTSLVQVISGGGRDIGLGGFAGAPGTDEFFYVHQGHSGSADVEAPSGTIEVQVTGVTGPNTGAKAGLMLRRDSTPDSTFFMVGITAAKTVFFQSRTVQGGPAVTLATKPNINFPVWLRMMFDGTPDPTKSRVATSYSINHVDWLPVYDQTFDVIYDVGGGGLPFPFQGLVGLAVTAHQAAPATATATFDKFTTTRLCDKPNVLNGKCDPRSRFKVLAQTSDAIVVANCRKEGVIDDAYFKDVAVIQYNRQNGAICYYQAPQGATKADKVTTPSLGSTGTNIFPWISPAATHGVGCPVCHDNGPFIRSPYLYQLDEFPKDPVYSNVGNKLRYVGRDFANDHTWWIMGKDPVTGMPDASQLIAPGDKFGACNSCHSLSVNDVTGTSNDGKGTSLYFAGIATAMAQQGKNPHSTVSPIWMRPDWAFPQPPAPPDPVYKPYLHFGPAEQSAGLFKACGDTLSRANFDVNHPDVLASNCLFTPNGAPYVSMLNSTTDASVGGAAGSAAGTLEFSTVTSGPNTDFGGTTDKFYWTNSYLPGDGTAFVKVTSLDALNPNTKAGLTVRDGPNPDAINAMVGITANNTSKSAFFQYRLTTTGQTVTTPTVDLTAKPFPFWLRLDRTGQTWVGSVSWDGGDTWTQVGTAATVNNLSQSLYGLAVSSKHASLGAQAKFESFEWSRAVGWAQAEDAHILVDAKIGANVTGSRKEKITTETMTSSGGDIFGNSDQFMYSFKGFIGEGTVITKVVSQTSLQGPLDLYAKAGLMIREDATPGAANVFLGKTPSGATIQQRKLPDPTTVVTNVSQPAVPTWFRLVRTNNTFIGSMSSDGQNWTQVGDPIVFTNFTWSPIVGLAVSSHGSGITQAIFDNGLAGSPEPPGFQWFPGQQSTWLDAAMGTTGTHRTDSATNTEIVTASGADIYNYADQFFYAWQNIAGNATITAQVIGLGGSPSGTPNEYAKAGVMFRDSATGGAPNAFMALTPAHGATFQYRPTAGAQTPAPVFVPGSLNYWVRVVRSGAASNVYTGYVSSNGAAWTQVGTVTMNTIAQSALVGLAVTSHDASKSVKATFANVTISQP